MRFVASRGAVAERLVRGTAVAERLVRSTAVAERHREDVACCGTADAEPAGKGTAGTEDCLLGRRGRARAQPWQSAIGKMLLTVAPPMRSQLAGWSGRRGGARALPRVCGTEQALLRSKGADNTQASPRSTSDQQSAGAPAGQWRWQKARAGAGRQILSDSPSDLAITSAAQVLPYVFTAVRGISQSC